MTTILQALMSAELNASRRDATLILTLSNPGAHNVLHPDMYAAAIETLSTAERDDSVKVVVLTGAEHFFSAGENLHLLLDNRAAERAVHADWIDQLHGWIDAIRDCPKPVIAAVDGAAAGAGFALALACDLIVAGHSAQFAASYARLGLTPSAGMSWFLAQTLPRQLVSEILLEGRPQPASRLHAVGLVNRLVPDGTALDAALDWADELAALPGAALERIKSLIREAPDHSLSRHFEAERHNFIDSLQDRDAAEGIAAFLEKRPPNFR